VNTSKCKKYIKEKATPYQSVCFPIVLFTSATKSCKTPYKYHPFPSTLPFKDAQTNLSPTYLPHNNTYSMYLHVPSIMLNKMKRVPQKINTNEEGRQKEHTG